MRIAGIIAEYNPFHNGHAYHIDQTRRQTNCDYVIAVMDGHITQRGEMSILSKWDRTRMALSCGVDAVFELPTLFAVRSAEGFAAGGVGILSGLGADVISCGCEADAIPHIHALAELALHEPAELQNRIHAKLAEGKSHPQAVGEAYAEYLNIPAELFNLPNAALAREYAKALRKLESRTELLCVPRIGEYHDTKIRKIASASAVRMAWRENRFGDAFSCVPSEVKRYFIHAIRHDHPLDDVCLYKIRNMSAEMLANLPDVSEGIEQRIQKCASEAETTEALVSAVKCRRYTQARIMRMLIHAMLDMDSSWIRAYPQPVYARLLGMRADAKPLLAELSRRTTLPIVSSVAELRKYPMFTLECRATDLWSLSQNEPEYRKANRELTEKFIRME